MTRRFFDDTTVETASTINNFHNLDDDIKLDNIAIMTIINVNDGLIPRQGASFDDVMHIISYCLTPRQGAAFDNNSDGNVSWYNISTV
jgi:hypothetical protein